MIKLSADLPDTQRAAGGAAMWRDLFALPPRPGLALQARLRAAIVQPILDGRLPPGAALPSSRDLARVLSISRNTVTDAYQQLVDQAFLEARPRQGMFVASRVGTEMVGPTNLRYRVNSGSGSGAKPSGSDSDSPSGSESGFPSDSDYRSNYDSDYHSASPAGPLSTDDQIGSGRLKWAHRVRQSMLGRPSLGKPKDWAAFAYPFVYGTHDPQLFPVEDFRECCLRSLGRAQVSSWTPDLDSEDVPDLIEQIRVRLLPKRGIFALPDEILITVGAQHAFTLLAETLFDAQTRVGFEEPGYPHARNSFALRGARLLPVPVDSGGAVPEPLPALDYLFLTPSQQSPTTVALSLPRRSRLLELAALQDFVIIEDDYEAENLYAGAPMPALKSLDSNGRVIYIGSMSKNLAPALRLGYIVAPRELIAELRAVRHAAIRHPSTLLQHAYAMFLSLGHHDAHARRVNQATARRIGQAAAALTRWLPSFQFQVPQGGASIWLCGPAWMDGRELAELARSHGVLIEIGDEFFQRPPHPCPFLRLRLSSIAEDRIDGGIQALAAAYGELARARGQSPDGD